jgi:hypothetical protein
MLRGSSGTRLLPCSHTYSQPDVKRQVLCWRNSLAHPYLMLDMELLFRRHAAACYSSCCCSTPATIATQQPSRTQLSAGSGCCHACVVGMRQRPRHCCTHPMSSCALLSRCRAVLLSCYTPLAGWLQLMQHPQGSAMHLQAWIIHRHVESTHTWPYAGGLLCCSVRHANGATCRYRC